MTKNDYLPFSSKILEVIPHTDIEYTFRMSYNGDVKPGQFFEVSLPKYGEGPEKHPFVRHAGREALTQSCEAAL